MSERKVNAHIERPEVVNRVAVSLKPVMVEAAGIISTGQVDIDHILHQQNFVTEMASSVVSRVWEGKEIKENELLNKVSAATLIGKWLAKPRTIASFQDLKYSMLCWNFDLDELVRGILDSEFIDTIRRVYRVNTDQVLWHKPAMGESVGYFFKMADRLKILQRDRIVYERQRYGAFFTDQLWNRIENDRPQDAPRATQHDSLESLVEDIKRWRHIDLSRTYRPRLGLIFGDFRVGLHPGHHEMMEHAKVSLGRDGRLVVITPSRLEIENVAKKSPVWDDEIRLALIANNRYVSDVWLADMGEEYWKKPEEYWSGIWGAIKPDLVFLGESNHPLEPKYRRQSETLGGILLIDDSIKSNVRSGNLLSAA